MPRVLCGFCCSFPCRWEIGNLGARGERPLLLKKDSIYRGSPYATHLFRGLSLTTAHVASATFRAREKAQESDVKCHSSNLRVDIVSSSSPPPLSLYGSTLACQRVVGLRKRQVWSPAMVAVMFLPASRPHVSGASTALYHVCARKDSV